MQRMRPRLLLLAAAVLSLGALVAFLAGREQRRSSPMAELVPPPWGAPAGLVTCASPGAPTRTCAVPRTPPVPVGYGRCCYTLSPQTGTCSTGGCAAGELACDGPDDCAPGYACIMHLGRSRCALASVPPDLRLCRTSADCLSVAPTCGSAVGVPPNVGVCQ